MCARQLGERPNELLELAAAKLFPEDNQLLKSTMISDCADLPQGRADLQRGIDGWDVGVHGCTTVSGWP